MSEAPPLDAARALQLVAGPRTEVVFHGESMWPLLHEGDRVILEPVTPAEIRLGDIVTYRYLDRYPTRRVVRVRPDRLTLWCDNWPTRRYSAAPGDVLARVLARDRDGERLGVDDPGWRKQRTRAARRYRLVRWRLDARGAGRALRRFVRR